MEMVKQRKLKSLRPLDVLVTSLVCLFLIAVIPLLHLSARFNTSRTICARNLSEIGRAMLIYAADYEGKYPRAGGTQSVWIKTGKEFLCRDGTT